MSRFNFPISLSDDFTSLECRLSVLPLAYEFMGLSEVACANKIKNLDLPTIQKLAALCNMSPSCLNSGYSYRLTHCIFNLNKRL